jgi:hypothetical protein
MMLCGVPVATFPKENSMDYTMRVPLVLSQSLSVGTKKKGFVNPFGKALFCANFINGALKTAPYGLFASDFR